MRILVIILFFLSISLLYLAIFNLFRSSKKKLVNERMNRYLKQVVKKEAKVKRKRPQFNLNGMNRKIRKLFLTKTKNNKLELSLNRAGFPLKPEEYIMFRWISILLSAGILFLIINHLLAIPIGAMIGLFIPRFILNKKQRGRLQEFNDQLPDMIAAVIAALRAGFSFPQALKSVAEEAKAPMKEELTIVLKEMQYGSTTEEALYRLYERMPSEDLDLMIQAVLIQRQVGGNLATVLQKIVQTIRDRIKIQRQISTLTAQGRLSGMIIGLLPLILGGVLYLIEPEYIGKLLTHPIGIGSLILASISSIIGFLLIRKLTTIEV